MPSSLDDFPILTSVRVVCRECLSLRELPHINKHIHGFLQLGSIRKACNRGSLRLMRLVAARDTKSHWGDVAMVAAQLGHLDILLWLSEFHTDRCKWDNVLDSAAASGRLPVVKWLHTNRQEKCSMKAMDKAASRGHLDVVKWLHDNRTEGCTEKAMTSAAENGHLDVVEWLHENTNEGCFPYTMDYVTDFEVVKWLHENQNRERLCSTTAIDNWAEMGRLDMVMWLYENRTEGYSIHAIEMAAQNGHLDVVKWLFHHEGDKRRYRCRGWRCRFCYYGSHILDFVQNESLSDFTMKMAKKKGQQHVIEWVESLDEPESAKLSYGAKQLENENALQSDNNSS